MDIRQLAELRLQTGYTFEDATPFYEKLGEERAAALLKALLAHGYRIVSEQELAARRVSSTPSDDDAQRTAGRVAALRRQGCRLASRGGVGEGLSIKWVTNAARVGETHKGAESGRGGV